MKFEFHQIWKFETLIINMIHLYSIVIIVIHSGTAFINLIMTHTYFVIAVIIFFVIFQDLRRLAIEVYLL